MIQQNKKTQGIYTKEDMLTQAVSEGYKVSARLIDDWVQAGLLGNAENREWPGRTHGSGSRARWSQHQRDLFFLLLRHRQRDKVRENGPLCNIPVWSWIYWGELGGVTLKQVRRALYTWAEFRRGQSYTFVHRNARDVVAMASHPRGLNKRELVEELSRIGVSGAYIDDEELRYLLDQVIGPHAKGPEQAQFSTDYIASMIGIRALAMQKVDDVLALPNALWEWAKVSLLTTYVGYQQMQPQFATDPQLGYRFPRHTIYTLCESSCYYLFTLLGIAYQQGPMPGVPPMLHPISWKTGEVQCSFQTRIVRSILLSPNGTPFSSLVNLVVLQYWGHTSTIYCQIPFL